MTAVAVAAVLALLGEQHSSIIVGLEAGGVVAEAPSHGSLAPKGQAWKEGAESRGGSVWRLDLSDEPNAPDGEYIPGYRVGAAGVVIDAPTLKGESDRPLSSRSGQTVLPRDGAQQRGYVFLGPPSYVESLGAGSAGVFVSPPGSGVDNLRPLLKEAVLSSESYFAKNLKWTVAPPIVVLTWSEAGRRPFVADATAGGLLSFRMSGAIWRAPPPFLERELQRLAAHETSPLANLVEPARHRRGAL